MMLVPACRVRCSSESLGSIRPSRRSRGLESSTTISETGPRAEPEISIAAPIGQLDARFPLRGRDTLRAALTDPTSGSRVRVVHGMGGCGKTRLALEVASQLQERDVEVWWVSAADESRLTAGMRAVARRVGVTHAELRHGDAADLLWHRLAGRQQEWLLVIDNADDPQVLAGPSELFVDGTGWLRPLRTPAGMVLVTSRDGRPSSWGSWCRLHQVEVLASGDAAQILADHADGQELGNTAEAEALAQRLGRLPLALKIAGSFLAKSVAIPAAFAAPGAARTYSQYLAALECGQLETAFPSPSAGELTPEQARRVIGRTWELTLDLLAARQMPEARLAGDAGDWDRAAALHGAAQAFLDRTGSPWEELEARYRRDSLGQARAHLGDEQLERAYAAGIAFSLEKALDLALQRWGPP
jgi:NB-ARC domain